MKSAILSNDNGETLPYKLKVNSMIHTGLDKTVILLAEVKADSEKSRPQHRHIRKPADMLKNYL
jgi:hypothetical protein